MHLTAMEWEKNAMGAINFEKEPINFKNMKNCEFYPYDHHL